MELTESRFFDYIKCPLYYDLKYNKKTPISEGIIVNSLLIKASNYFFTNLLNNRIITQNDMKNKWDKICEHNINYLSNDDIVNGFAMLISFLRWAYQNKPVPVDIESAYNIIHNNINIYGQLPIILISSSNKYELFYVDFSRNKTIDKLRNELEFKLKYTLAAYGYQQVYQQDISAIKILLVKKSEIVSTYKTKEDYEHLKSALYNVNKAIENDIYYPRENIYCPKCQYRLLCKYIK